MIDGEDRLLGTASGDGQYAAGVVFELSHSALDAWNYSALCSFPGQQAAAPANSLTFDKNGTLYGTALFYDHQGNGAVFMLGK